MEEDELQALTLNPTPEHTPPPLAPLPVPPPMAPIPAPPPASLLRARAALQGSTVGSDSDREGSTPPPPSSSAADYEVSEASRQARERQERAVQELLMRRRAYAMAVPTNDSAVRARLRRLGEPVTLFGEREMERRDRLRSLMARLDAEGQLDRLLKAHEDEQAAQAAAAAATEEEEGPQSYPFYTEGSRELFEARVEIAQYSLARAATRLERAKQRRDNPDEDVEAEAEFAVEQAAKLVLDCSEIGDDRPLSGCSFSHDGALLATRYSMAAMIFGPLLVNIEYCVNKSLLC